MQLQKLANRTTVIKIELMCQLSLPLIWVKPFFDNVSHCINIWITFCYLAKNFCNKLLRPK